MQPRDVAYLRHMLDFAGQVAVFVAGVDKQTWQHNKQLQLAVAHLVQMIGEAARKVSEPGREVCPGVPWREIVGMRNRIVHEYMDVDFDVVWRVAVDDLPALSTALTAVFAGDGKS